MSFLLKLSSTNTSILTLKLFTSLPAIDPLIVEWRQKSSNKNITKVIEMSNAAAEEASHSNR